MKKFVILAALALGACSQAQQQQVQTIVSQAQADTVQVCGYLPTVETVSGILAVGNPLLATGEAIANAICAALTPKGAIARPGVTVPYVAGVPVHGKFVH